MFKSASTQGDLNGFLDAGSHMKGELHFEDTFRIDGQLTGSAISKKGDLVIGESGEVDGEVQVARAFVSGTVKGTLRATGRVEITAAGRVLADIFAPSLVIEEGAFFEGRCSMQGQARGPGQERGPGQGREDDRKVAQMPLARKG